MCIVWRVMCYVWRVSMFGDVMTGSLIITPPGRSRRVLQWLVPYCSKHYNQTPGGSWEDLLSSLCPPRWSDVQNTLLAMARLLPSLLDSSPGQGPGLLLNGFRLFRDRAPTMEAYIWTPSVVTIKFNVKNGVLLKQRETNDFRVINSFVYFYHLKIINRSLVVLASYKIYDK